MTNPLTIPQDIIDGVIEAIDTKSTLRRCALVSSSFLLPSRKRLFSHIHLRSDTQCKRLHSVLIENSHILSFITNLTVIRRVPQTKLSLDLWFSKNPSSLLAILRLPLHRLTAFSLVSSPPFLQWGRISSNVQAAIQHIIRLPSLSKLHLSTINRMPISLLSDMGLVKHLFLNEVYLDIPETVEQQSAQDGARLEGYSYAPAVEQFTWKLRRDIKFEGMFNLPPITFMPSSRSMKLDGVIDLSSGFGTFPFMIRILDSSLGSHARLEHLKLTIEFVQPWIFSTDIDWSQPIRLLEIWRQMDMILTHSAYSRLQKVEIIAIIPPEAQIAEMGDMETLVHQQLPLLHAKNILIVEKATDLQGN